MRTALFQKLYSSITVVERLLTEICAVVLGSMTAIVLVGVFFRYVLHNALPWTEELTRYMLIFVGLLGAALALWRDEHVGFSVVLDRMPSRVRKSAKIISYLLIAVFAGVVAYHGLVLAFTSGTRAQILPIPMCIPLSLVPVSGLLMLLFLVVKILSDPGR